MAEAKNALAPKVTGVNKLVDWVAQRLDPTWFPTAGRTLLETVQGNRNPITEANFSPAELETMRQMIANKRSLYGQPDLAPKNIQYSDYESYLAKLREEGKDGSISPGLLSMSDPLGNVQTTLGRFNYTKDPNGNWIVTDTYDFNPIYSTGVAQEANTGDYGAISPYGLIRNYAGEKIPPGYGRNVRINLGK